MMQVRSWDDVNRLDVRPDRGMDGLSPLGSHRDHPRRPFFGGDWIKLGLFLPAGLTMFLMWLSGLWMSWVPFIAKAGARRSRGGARDDPDSVAQCVTLPQPSSRPSARS